VSAAFFPVRPVLRMALPLQQRYPRCARAVPYHAADAARPVRL